jgi:hypothetical protein
MYYVNFITLERENHEKNGIGDGFIGRTDVFGLGG